MNRQTWITAILGLFTAVTALILFLFTSRLGFAPSPKSTSTPTPVVTASAIASSPGSTVADLFSLSVAVPASIDLDSNPPTIGFVQNSTLAVTDANFQAAMFQAELPSSIAPVRTSQAPTFKGCQALIKDHPTLMASVPLGGRLCVRTARGATGLIQIKHVSP